MKKRSEKTDMVVTILVSFAVAFLATFLLAWAFRAQLINIIVQS